MRRFPNLITIAMLSLLAVAPAFATRQEPMPVPPELVGVWHKGVKLLEPLATLQREAGPAWEHVEFSLVVHEDGRVEGSLGGARLADCRLESNRGALGRLLRVKTDWIIRGGTLRGAVVPGDTDTLREFTIPIDVDRNCVIDGTMMQIFPVRYPMPICRMEGMERLR